MPDLVSRAHDLLTAVRLAEASGNRPARTHYLAAIEHLSRALDHLETAGRLDADRDPHAEAAYAALDGMLGGRDMHHAANPERAPWAIERELEDSPSAAEAQANLDEVGGL